MEDATNFLWGRRSLRDDIFIKPPKFDNKKESAHTYASFGDNGMTVSVNAYGHIMQMSRYLGFGCSGFLCVDSQYSPPWYVQARTEDILESSKDPNQGLRLDIMDWSGVQNLSSGFMYDRWPRYVVDRETPSEPGNASVVPPTQNSSPPTTGPVVPIPMDEEAAWIPPGENSSVPRKKPFTPTAGCSLSLQYYCFENTVIQQYQLLVGDSGIPHDKINWGNLSLIPKVSIRSLNFVDDLDFDDERVEPEQRVLSDSSIMLVRTIPEGHYAEEESKQYHTAEDSTEHGPQMNMVEQPVAAALIISPFVNNRPANIVDGTCINLERVEGEVQLVITVAYTVKLLYSDCQEVFKISEPANVVDNSHKAMSVVNAETTERSVPETIANADDDQEASPTVDAETDQRCVPKSNVANVSRPDTSSEQADAHGTSTVGTKNDLTIKKRELAEAWASEVMEAMQEMSAVFYEETTFRRIRFSPNEDLDYAFRRNLEHILSVCSIPVAIEQNKVPRSLRGPAVAITCGDIAGHRIGPRASLAAIQFLCLLFPFLGPGNDHELHYSRIMTEAEQDRATTGSKSLKDPDAVEATHTSGLTKGEEIILYLCQLQSRIIRILKGHMVWICATAECSRLHSFYPHHWPNGRRIFNLDWLPLSPLVDTPLQLLKVHCYDKLTELSKDEVTSEQKFQKEWMQKRLRVKARGWIDEIHNLNDRGTYAFADYMERPRYRWLDANQNAKYRLTDHVMIGLALKSVEQLKLQTEDHVWAWYSPEEVRSKILKRFTTENPISKQRMLATSRWKDETRFLLHTKDAFLFSNEGLNYLQDNARAAVSSNRKDKRSDHGGSVDPWRYTDRRWAKLLDAQAYHDEFQFLEWDNPLWYALVLILACKGIRINNETSERLAGSSRSVLLGTASYNGLFAGQLGHKNVSDPPKSEYDRDDYWFRTFEIAHILWSLNFTDETSAAQGKASPPLSTDHPISGPLATSKETTRVGQQVEKHVPFTNIGPSKTQTGIIVLSDDWLQDPPAFLAFPSELEKTTDSIEDRHRSSFRSNHELAMAFGPIPKSLPSDVAGLVIDVPKWSLGTEISTCQLASQEFSKRLKQQTIWESKKRIVWLPYGDKSAAKRCLDVSSSVEKESLLSFMRRNWEHEKYFLDSATVELNEWETELHLSFFGISDKRGGSLHELENRSYLTSYTMSLRFSGDFSDRYWTCYFLEPQTSKTVGKTLGQRLPPSRDCGIRGDLGLSASHADALDASGRLARRKEKQIAGRWQQIPWQQRKVLELLIYSKMLEELRENTNSIFRAVKRLALRSHNDKHPDEATNSFRTAIEEANRLQQLGEKEEYASIAKEWRRYIQILIVVEENLVDNIEKIDQWEQREQDRQSQQPRWTDRDQRNHFTTILRLKILTGRQAGEIKRLREDIRAFRDSLPSQLESIREDISFRGSQNINLFTYVTIVFLPLGFATGTLSMNGPPDHDLLMKLVYLSLAAFGLTLFALLNARSVKLILPLFVRFPPRLVKHFIFHRIAIPIIRRFAQQEKLQAKEQREKSRKKMLESALVASLSTLPAVAALRSESIHANLDHSSQRQHLKEQDFLNVHSVGNEGWLEKYQNILHFSFLTAVSREKRKQSKEPIQESTKNIQEPKKFSLKNLVHRRKQNRDVEQGDDSINEIVSFTNSDTSSLWPTGFSSVDDSWFDDTKSDK